jgi:DNA polymerase I-like protein with 3'-5' exonuclease and polymerase domains
MHDEIIVETREESVDEVQGIIEEFRGGVSENHS